jgi:hypothetical protein
MRYPSGGSSIVTVFEFVGIVQRELRSSRRGCRIVMRRMASLFVPVKDLIKVVNLIVGVDSHQFTHLAILPLP